MPNPLRPSDRGGRSLRRLLADWQAAVAGTGQPFPPVFDGPDIHLSRLTEKTGEVEPGTCFVARVRPNSDGHAYIATALARGASMILAQRSATDVGVLVPEGVVYFQVADTAETLAWLAAAWERFPSRELVMIGITGTDGKSSTANILHEILQEAGLKVGLLSTIRAVIGQAEEPLAPHVTTPEAPVVQRYLRRMVDLGLTHCVLEATSHGLAQHRVTALDFDAAVLTNITHEHLDEHGDFASYFAAKARLFESLSSSTSMIGARTPEKGKVTKTAILNRDDESYVKMRSLVTVDCLTYGIYHPADVSATRIDHGPDRTRLTLHLGNTEEASLRSGEHIDVESALVGEFNVYNMLAAASAARWLGVAPAAIRSGLQRVRGIDGRMERIDRGQPYLAMVDFAHTPNALAMAIKAARRMSSARVILLFGSAGKRDVQKRRLMAEVAAQQADLIVLTAEDPRTDSLEAILGDMAAGCRRQGGLEGTTFWRVPDRGQAIYFALSLARAGDVVLICGKGHEQSMCFGDTEFPWDDRAAARTALDRLLERQPMLDLGLPTFDPALALP
jgi:UDP-N-acetylmuramoyl-L-alanyl-D-glutamate--2,6-diaminopimelate ligase